MLVNVITSSSEETRKVPFTISVIKSGNSEEETMLGVKIGNKLPFYNYKEKMNSKAVLSRTTPF